jgi:N-methylhydantoinase A
VTEVVAETGANGAGPGRFLVGIDVGGTFTDGVAYDPKTGALLRAKVATTADQSDGTMAVFAALGIDARDVATVYHGFTVGLNAVLTRRGARTGLICTMGFRDLMDIGRVERPFGDPQYDPHWMRPHQERPIVERRHRREVPGRLLHDGAVYEDLDLERIREECEFLRSEGVEAVGVCFVNAYANLEFEDRALEIVREVLPAAYVQSSRTLPVAGEFDRTFAVSIDAYTGPEINRYLSRLGERMRSAGHDQPIQVMQMNGGLRTLEATMGSFPALTLSSGPVAGALGAEFYARNILDSGNLACVDIGGTSTDLALVQDGAPAVTENWEIEQAMPLGVPTVDVRSIGAGGGSLVKVDHVGTMTVGPESAGARPGPVGYGHGGTVPTLTDAYITLGYIAPELFLGGKMAIDVEAARASMAVLGETLGLGPEEVAANVHDHVNRDIAGAVRAMAFDAAADMRLFSLFAYGGAGPLHAVPVAQALGMESVVIPYFPGGFSAVGMIVTKPKVEHLAAQMHSLGGFDPAGLGAEVEVLEARALADLEEQNVAAADATVERFVYVMYAGQSFDNRLPLRTWPLDEAALTALRGEVDTYYERVYGYNGSDLDVVVTKVAVTATGAGARLELPRVEAGGEEPADTAIGLRRDIYLDGAVRPQSPFYLRQELRAGNVLNGPAVIDDELGTVLLPGGSRARVDDHGTLLIDWEEVR